MLAKVRITTVLLLMALPIALLQGCGSNSGNVDSADGGQNLNLSLTTPNGATTLIADGNSSTQVQMTVTDQDGQPLADIPVIFSTNAGVLSTVAGTNVINTRAATRQTGDNSSITVGTNAQGIALVQLTSSTTVETATVTAEVEGFRQSFGINFISGIPAQLTVSVSPSIVGVGETATVEALVIDSDNQPLAGVDVTFTLTSTGSGASISPTTRATDDAGSARVTYTAGTTPGTDTIQAQLGATTSSTATTLSQSTSVIVQDTGTAASNVQLLVSSPQMDSDGLETVTLTALVRDDNNNFISGTNVTFSADSGGIQVTNGTTDASGAATAVLSTAGDASNRTIRVEAFVTGLSPSVNFVEVSGTTITLSGTSSLVLGETATLSILLQDSGGNGIAQQTVTLTSNQGNTITPAAVTTDFNGQATVDVTADVGNPDTITASALGATGVISLTVSTADFTFIAPAANREINLGDAETVIIRWLEAGVPQVGKTINFFATRGTLTVASAVTNANGDASTQISADSAGPAVITAEADEAGGPSGQISVEFVATNADSLILRADPTSLSVNLPGSTDQQSIITAVVRDADDNLVKNKQVSFTLTDTSGGSIFPSSAITDSFGRASTVYTAGSTPSAQDGVIVVALVVGTTGCNPADPIPSGPCDQVAFTVSQQSLFVTLGTSHLLTAPTSTQYAKPYSVLVTDANSNPIDSATVELNIYPTRYQKGFYTRFFDDFGLCHGWGKFLSINPVFGFGDDTDVACNNEDIDRNGILNPGEDINDNGVLDPGNVAEVPTTVVTDSTGFAFFDVLYAREFTWVEVELEARTTVAGSEGASKARFFLPGLAEDFNDCDVAPPGFISPEGRAQTCSCDEAVDPSCPIRTFHGPVILTPASTTVPPNTGAIITFTPAGGTESTYIIQSTGGSLLGSTIVNFGDTFLLDVPVDTTDFIDIIVTAIDGITGEQGTAVVERR